MMRLSRSMVLLLLSTLTADLLAGCAAPPPKVEPKPQPVAATPQQAAMVQEDLAKLIPGSLVGHVSAVMGSQVAVTFSTFPDAKKGQSVVFTDASSLGIANGTIYSIDQSSPAFPMLIVDVEPTASGRLPVKGDLAVYAPPAAPAAPMMPGAPATPMAPAAPMAPAR